MPGQLPLHPDEALAYSVHKLQMGLPIADRVPRLKQSAYGLILLLLFSMVQAYAMRGILVSMLGEAAGHGVIGRVTQFIWVLGVLCACILLRTKRIRLVKRLLIAVGAALIYFTLTDLASFSLVGVAVDGFLIWWTYDIYQAVEGVEYADQSFRARG